MYVYCKSYDTYQGRGFFLFLRKIDLGISGKSVRGKN